jgi:hypothetical protein
MRINFEARAGPKGKGCKLGFDEHEVWMGMEHGLGCNGGSHTNQA